MTILNILHLSDLHFSKKTDTYNQGIILKALNDDLKAFCSGTHTPDLIIFSGDLAHAADEPDIYLYLLDEVIEPICKITRCAEKRVLVCPGNHDAHRSVVEQKLHHQTGLAENLTDRDRLNQEFLSGKLDEFISKKFQAFSEFRQILGTEGLIYTDSLTQVFRFDELSVDIQILNTAWMTWAGISGKRDKGSLLLPEAAVQKGLDRLKPQNRRLAVCHHPSSWLESTSESDLLRSIDGAIDGLFFGHVHDAHPTSLSDLKGKRLTCQSGALYTGRTRYNGYSLIRIDKETGNAEVHLRSYFPNRPAFDYGLDIVRSGIFYPDSGSRSFWRQHGRQVDRDKLKIWIYDVLLPAAKANLNAGISDRPVCDVFVPPPMYSHTIIREGGEAQLPEREEVSISLDTILKSQSNYILYGRQEYGKTTLLQQIALKILQEALVPNPPSIPILIEFARIRPGSNRIVRELVSALDAPLEDVSMQQLLDEGLATILIDDVDFADSVRMTLVQKFIAENPKNRFLFTTLTDAADKVGIVARDIVAAVEAPVTFTHVFLRPFTRRNMRSLVEKWDRDGRLDTDAILDRITREFSNINIPVTAFNGTILLSIYEAQTQFRPINRASLIERFLEHLLEKRSLQETERRSFDFTNKVRLLGFIAENMAQRNKYIFLRGEILTIIQGYLDHIGFAQRPDEILHIFLGARVIAQRYEDRFSFRYRAFLEYFIASEMHHNKTFRDWVLQEEQYLSFINEIQYYAGIVRSDHQLVDLLGERLHALTEQALSELNMSLDLNSLEKFEPPADDSTGDIFDQLVDQMKIPPLSREERDSILDGELPRDAEARQEVFRPLLEHLGHKWTVALLLYSGVIKNMELISDDSKREHLSKVLRSWGFFTIQSFVLIPQLAKHRQLRVNGVMYQVSMPRHFSEAKIARLIYLDMPSAISKLVTWVLGTEKLEKQLAEPTLGEADEAKIVAFYRHTLIADLRIGDWCSAMEKFTRRLTGSRYLLEAFSRKVFDTYLLGGTTTNKEVQLRNIIGEIVGELRGKTRDDRQRIKSREIQRVQRNALINRVRTSRDG